MLFNVPSVAGTTKKGINVNGEDIQIAEEVLGIHQPPVCIDEDIHELLFCYMQMQGLHIPKDSEGGLDLYIKLLECLENDNFQI